MRETLKGRVALIAVFVFFGLFLFRPPIVTAATNTVNVLFIASLEPGDNDLQDILQTFKQEFRDRGVRTEVFMEFLDVIRIPADQERLEFFEESLRSRYVGMRFDVILAQGNSVAELVVRYRDRFFPGIPVYCFDRGLGPEYAKKYKDSPGVYGRTTTTTVPDALRLAARLFPDAQEILLIIPEMSAMYRDNMLKVLRNLQAEFPASSFKLVTVEDFKSFYVSSPRPQGHLIVMVPLPGAWKLEDENMISGTDLIDWLSEQYPYPIFGTKKSDFGTGFFGGAFLDPVLLGHQAGRDVFEILFSEEKPEPWRESNTESTVVDYRALRKFHVPMSRVPKDAVVMFAPPGFWIRFENEIKIAVAILLFSSVAMGVVLVFRRREHRLLIRINARLEGIVEQRTEELKTANQELEAANANLKQSLRRIENMQESLLDNERDVVLGRMAVGIAHEINNPLAAVKGSAFSLLELMGDGAESLFNRLDRMDKKQWKLFRETVKAILAKNVDASFRQDASEKKEFHKKMREWMPGVSPGQVEMAYDAGLSCLDHEAIERLDITGDDTVLRALYMASVMDQSAVIIDQASDRIANTVEAFRSYASAQENTTCEAASSVADTVDHALSLLRDPLQKGITLRVSVETNLAEVHVASFKLVRVWVNLIQNSIQAMGGKGTLEIHGFMSESDVQVDVRDSGPGVDPDIRSRLFTPFPSAEKKGTGMGLGLSICRKIVEAANGSILYGETGDWTVFTVRLPGVRR